jgi:hypothetical protein
MNIFAWMINLKSIQNVYNFLTDSVDTLDDRQKVFFSNCRKLKPAERDEEYEKIKKEYSKERTTTFWIHMI